MNKIVYKILSKYKKFVVDRNAVKYKRLIKLSTDEVLYQPGQPVFADGSFISGLIYKNEDWQVVKKRFHDRFLVFFNLSLDTVDNSCTDNKVKVEGNNLFFESEGLKDDWIYFYQMDYNLRDYELKFDAAFYSKFREIQFGFRYINFYNRYRFRVEKNRLHFDIVSKGQFYNSVHEVPLVLETNETYKFLIVVKGDQFSFVCNGKTVMTITDDLHLFEKGGVALILWDDCGKSNIKASFKEIQFNTVS